MFTNKKNAWPKRRAVAATETALLLPATVVVVFAAIDCANAIYLKQSLTVAAYEAASVLEEKQGTSEGAEARCEESLSARGIDTFDIQVSPSPDSLAAGDVFLVNVSSPASSYGIGPQFFFLFSELEATVAMVRH